MAAEVPSNLQRIGRTIVTLAEEVLRSPAMWRGTQSRTGMYASFLPWYYCDGSGARKSTVLGTRASEESLGKVALFVWRRAYPRSRDVRITAAALAKYLTEAMDWYPARMDYVCAAYALLLWVMFDGRAMGCYVPMLDGVAQALIHGLNVYEAERAQESANDVLPSAALAELAACARFAKNSRVPRVTGKVLVDLMKHPRSDLVLDSPAGESLGSLHPCYRDLLFEHTVTMSKRDSFHTY